jgi:hypothetical protein
MGQSQTKLSSQIIELVLNQDKFSKKRATATVHRYLTKSTNAKILTNLPCTYI